MSVIIIKLLFKELLAENKSLTSNNSEASTRIKQLENENFQLREFNKVSLNAVTKSSLQNTNK